MLRTSPLDEFAARRCRARSTGVDGARRSHRAARGTAASGAPRPGPDNADAQRRRRPCVPARTSRGPRHERAGQCPSARIVVVAPQLDSHTRGSRRTDIMLCGIGPDTQCAPPSRAIRAPPSHSEPHAAAGNDGLAAVPRAVLSVRPANEGRQSVACQRHGRCPPFTTQEDRNGHRDCHGLRRTYWA